VLRYFAGAVSALLLVAAIFLIVRSQADAEDIVPPAPAAAPIMTPLKQGVSEPPSAPAKSREEKRFARADKDDDGRITRDELLQPRRKAFAKLDGNGDGRLSFEEWAVKTSAKFAGADADRSGWLSPREYETTKPKPAPKKKCAC
jgi:EF hand